MTGNSKCGNILAILDATDVQIMFLNVVTTDLGYNRRGVLQYAPTPAKFKIFF
jgi:hypothetical protein